MPLTSVSSKAATSLTLFWSCELNWDSRAYTFDPLEDKNCIHKLMLNVVCLGEKNNDDVNIVEIIPAPTKDGKEGRAVTIATLRPSVLPMANISGMELTPPITFYLRCGSGPVHISGYANTVTIEQPWEEKVGIEEDEETDTASEQEEEKEAEKTAEEYTGDDDDAHSNDSDPDSSDTSSSDSSSSGSSSNDSSSNNSVSDDSDSRSPKAKIASAKRPASCSKTGVAKKTKLEDEHGVPYLRSTEMKAKDNKKSTEPSK